MQTYIAEKITQIRNIYLFQVEFDVKYTEIILTSSIQRNLNDDDER